ncbi:MAG: ribosomal-processing cysteine protease Prp [Mycoplasma sp.]
MIKIEFYKNGLIVSGHANSAPHGKDIYCAGVSAITMSSINWFKEDEIDYEIKDGYLKLKVLKLNENNLYLLSLIEIQLKSFDDKDSMKYIELIQKTDKEI